MRSKHIWLLAFCLLFSSAYTFAQGIKLTGKVVDATTNKPVPYANIGVKGKAIGTVANAAGEFSFTANSNDLPASPTLVVSCVGYNSNTIPLIKHDAPIQVKLKQQVVAISEVTVKPRKLKRKVLGKNDREYFTSTVFFNLYEEVNDELGRELGNIIKVSGNACYVNDFNFYVNYNQFKSIKLRFNLYTVQGGLPGQSLLHEDVLFALGEKEKGWIKLDLRKYNIMLEGVEEVAVTIQWLESEQYSEKEKFMAISGAITPFKKYIRREKSEADWSRTGANLSMYLNADCYKPEEADTAVAP